MRLTIEPTPNFFMAGDVTVRMWEGTDEHGTKVVAMVAMVSSQSNIPELAAGLISIPAPDARAQEQWARKVLEGKVK